MIDYLLRFDDEVAAIADPVIGAYYIQDIGWRGDVCFKCQVFDGTIGAPWTDNYGFPRDGDLIPLPSFFLWLSLVHEEPAVLGLSSLVVAANRDLSLAGSTNFIIKSALSNDQLNTYTISPVIAGSSYPFGTT